MHSLVILLELWFVNQKPKSLVRRGKRIKQREGKEGRGGERAKERERSNLLI